MAELVQRTFRVTLEVTVSVNEIDEALVKRHEKYFHDPALATRPETLEAVARNRRLLAAVVDTPDVLTRVLIQRAADSLESIHLDDGTLEELQTNQRAEEKMIEDLREALPEADYEFHRGSCQEDFFYDNSTYFQDAFTTHQDHVTIQELPEPQPYDTHVPG